ncbi:hypothetical protein Tco_0684326 [Tanacetum coccineum]
MISPLDFWWNSSCSGSLVQFFIFWWKRYKGLKTKQKRWTLLSDTWRWLSNDSLPHGSSDMSDCVGGKGAGPLANRRLLRGQSYEYGRLAGRIPRLLEGAFIGNRSSCQPNDWLLTDG